MSGSEIPASKAAVEVAKKALGTTSTEKQRLADIAQESPEMKAAAQKYAQRLEIKQGILLKMYAPLAKWAGASREYFEDEFSNDMLERVDAIPEGDLAAPTPSVAVPAMQGLGYSLDEPTLKEMYLNLLATSSDARRSEEAHPSFADIIRQLSGREAKLLPRILTRQMLPIARINRRIPETSEGSGHTLVLSHALPLRDHETGQFLDEPLLPIWIENWVRLGLVEVDYGRFLTADGAYSWVDEHPVPLEIAATDGRGSEALRIDKGLLRATEFGTMFARVATPNS